MVGGKKWYCLQGDLIPQLFIPGIDFFEINHLGSKIRPELVRHSQESAE